MSRPAFDRCRLCPLLAKLSLFERSILHNTIVKKELGAMVNKVRTNKKYPFKQMSPGETFKLNDLDVRGAQKLAYYYRSLCKRPIQVVVSKQDDGYYCRRVA